MTRAASKRLRGRGHTYVGAMSAPFVLATNRASWFGTGRLVSSVAQQGGTTWGHSSGAHKNYTLRIGYLRAKRRKAATQRNAPCTFRKPRSTSTVQKKAVRAAKGLDGPNPARRSRGLDSDPALGQQERLKRFYSGAHINLIHCGKARPPAEKPFQI